MVPKTDDANGATPIYRRFWVRWWAKPTEDWLAKQARKLCTDFGKAGRTPIIYTDRCKTAHACARNALLEHNIG